MSGTAKIKAVEPGGGEPLQRSTVTTAYQEESSAQPRNLLIYAHQIMSSPVITASIHESLNTIWSLFAKHKFHHLPLLDDQQKIQGIVSDRDILRFAANNHHQVGRQPIVELMNRQVISAAADTEVRVLAEVMCQRGIGAIPIVDDVVAVLGIVSRSDILRALVNRAPLELWV